MNHTPNFLKAMHLVATANLPVSVRQEYVRTINHFEGTKEGLSFLLASLLREHVSFFEQKLASSLATITQYEGRGISIIALGEQEYSRKLAQVYDPPLILLSKSVVPEGILNRSMVAVVGSRRCDEDGCSVAMEFSYELAKRGIVVVSGLALGIDGCAHRGALKSKAESSTLAVLGSGFDKFYPPQHRQLAAEIISNNGLVISQFEPNTVPFPSNFLNRNRVIAGLSSAVIVIQATARSGSLATARYAMEENRDVLVIPGNISDPRYEGSLSLLKQGAYLVSKIEDVIDFLKNEIPAVNEIISRASTKQPVRELSQLVQILREKGTLHLDQIKEAFPAHNSVETELLNLELDGVVRSEPGLRFALTRKGMEKA